MVKSRPWQLAPAALLADLQGIERDLGRVRAERWGPRTIDLDILLYDEVIQDDPCLTIPHPRMTERAFVLRPLAEISPDLVFPGTKLIIRELLQQLRDPEEARRIGRLEEILAQT